MQMRNLSQYDDFLTQATQPFIEQTFNKGVSCYGGVYVYEVHILFLGNRYISWQKRFV